MMIPTTSAFAETGSRSRNVCRWIVERASVEVLFANPFHPYTRRVMILFLILIETMTVMALLKVIREAFPIFLIFTQDAVSRIVAGMLWKTAGKRTTKKGV
jgi:hypothetical protein